MVAKVRQNFTAHFYPDGAGEDVRMGIILSNNAIFVDSRDEMQQERFFPLGIKQYFAPIKNTTFWYWRYTYYEVAYRSLDCCSAHGIGFHYVKPPIMYFLEYLLYTVEQPFGLFDPRNDTLPRKLSLKEIIAASDADAPGKFRKPHDDFHQLDPDEINY